VRLALGATVSQIVRAVLGPMARYVALGLALGLPIAWLVTRTSAALFFQVRPTDAWVYLVVAAVLGGVGLTAALVPARRASRVDPLTALRAE
jgi:putative ABC transport system permease protein